MDKKQIEVNIENVFASNRQAVNYIARATQGKAFSTVEARDCWQGGSEGFENDKKAASQPGNASFVLNRSPKKYVLKVKNIFGMCGHQTIDGTVGIAINPIGDKYDLFLPLNGANPTVSEKPIEDAISDALRGQGENFFLDAERVAGILNQGNRNEVAALTSVKDQIDKMIQNIKGAIIENEKKAKEISDEWNASKLEGIDLKSVLSNTPATLNVHTSTEA